MDPLFGREGRVHRVSNSILFYFILFFQLRRQERGLLLSRDPPVPIRWTEGVIVPRHFYL